MTPELLFKIVIFAGISLGLGLIGVGILRARRYYAETSREFRLSPEDRLIALKVLQDLQGKYFGRLGESFVLEVVEYYLQHPDRSPTSHPQREVWQAFLTAKGRST